MEQEASLRPTNECFSRRSIRTRRYPEQDDGYWKAVEQDADSRPCPKYQDIPRPFMTGEEYLESCQKAGTFFKTAKAMKKHYPHLFVD
jgi:hypothetical protein